MEEQRVCCHGKSTQRGEEERRKLINRLSRIEGQIRGIRRMLEQDAYCTDILIQSAAVNGAVCAFNKDLIDAHIRGCVVREIREGQDDVVEDLIGTLHRLMK